LLTFVFGHLIYFILNKINQVTENKSLQISSQFFFFNFLIFLDKADGKSIKKWKSFHLKHITRRTCSVPQLGGGKTRRGSDYPNFVRALLSKFLLRLKVTIVCKFNF